MYVNTFHFLVFVRQPHLSPRLSSDNYILSLDEEVIDVPGSYGLRSSLDIFQLCHGLHGLDILSVRMLFLSALFVVKLWGCRKSLCFFPALLKTLVMTHEGNSYEAGTTACCWSNSYSGFYRLRPSSTDTVRRSGGNGIVFRIVCVIACICRLIKQKHWSACYRTSCWFSKVRYVGFWTLM